MLVINIHTTIWIEQEAVGIMLTILITRRVEIDQ